MIAFRHVDYSTKYLRHETTSPQGHVTARCLKVHPETVYSYRLVNSTEIDKQVPAVAVLFQKPTKPIREVNVGGIVVPEWPPNYSPGTQMECGQLIEEFHHDNWILQRRGHIFMLEYQGLRLWSQYLGSRVLPVFEPL